MGGEEFQPKSFSKVYTEFHIDKAKYESQKSLEISFSHVNLVYKSQANRSGWFWKGLPGGKEERRDPVCCQVPEDQRQADTETGRDP